MIKFFKPKEVTVKGDRGRSERWLNLIVFGVPALLLVAGILPPAVVRGFLLTVLTLLCTVCLVAGYASTRTVTTWHHRRHVLQPLHWALTGLLRLPEGQRPGRYLRVSPRRDALELARVNLPRGFVGDLATKAAVEQVITSRLRVSDVSCSWQLAGRKPQLKVTAAPRPPAKVLYSDPAVAELVRKAKESAPLIGLTHRGKPVAVDLDSESPHVLMSVGTGGGKSTILRAIFAQLLSKGARGDILDAKRHSHSKWANGLPNVGYHRDTAEIHNALVALAEEGERRNRVVDQWEGDGDPDVGPRWVILLEEANATLARLKRYWQEVRTKDDPKESPAIVALAELLFMGRAVRMHVLLVAQSATAAALGGPEMRENFATRILARYTQNAWRMLIPEIPFVASTRHPGRVQVALGGVARETQVLFLTDAEARTLALSSQGVRPLVSGVNGRGTVALGTGTQYRSSHGNTASLHAVPDRPELEQTGLIPASELLLNGEPAAQLQPAEELQLVSDPNVVDAEVVQLVSLREAVEYGVLTCSLDVARKSSTGRDPKFPAAAGYRGAAKLYDPDQLRSWEAGRARARVGAR